MNKWHRMAKYLPLNMLHQNYYISDNRTYDTESKELYDKCINIYCLFDETY